VTPETLLNALLAGPTPEEREQGFESALPPGTRLVSAQVDGSSITVRLVFPDDYLETNHPPQTRLHLGPAPLVEGRLRFTTFDALASEAIIDQIVRTLFPLGYLDFHVEAQDPSELGVFRPLSAYLAPITIPPKGDSKAPGAHVPPGQPPVEVVGRPQGALSGKTIYVSAGHGWLWTGTDWRTQRSPSPYPSSGYYGPIIEDHNNAEVVNQYLLRYLWNAGADVWTARERDLNLFEQIIDDSTPGSVTSGTWETVSEDGFLNRYAWTSTNLAATAAVTWTTDPVSADGTYGLYVWYVSGPNRSSDARYTVHHAGGVTELTVDQRRHGYTWRYLGSFPVRAGETLMVSLNNRSTTPGRVVIADAVRLGGGQFDNSDLAIYDGLVETNAPQAPNKPWWEAAAFYQVQRLGLSPGDFASYNDVIARPLWARWEHAFTGDDAIFISWHTNGYNGDNDQISGTVSFIHSYQPATGSTALRHAIHGELIKDIRIGWDPAWPDLGERSTDLGELRELWDDNESNALPGVLLEIAYHDHFTNTDALKDPRFALLSARAVYQGIVKYYGEDMPLLPEPPTHLLAQNDGPGRIRVSWRPSPTDDVGLVGDAAESYRVYTSHDGLGWDAGQTVTGTETTLIALEDDASMYVRVTAVNAGGESFPTPVLAARSSPDGLGQILVVDGFDRIDRHGVVLEDDPTEGINARLFPDRINSFDYVIQHGEHIPFPFDSAANEAVAEGDLNLTAYGVVDWMLGEESTADHTFDLREQSVLTAYLDNEGGLFVSGAEIGWDLVTQGNGPDFYRTYLGADVAGDDADTYLAAPTAGGIFADLGVVEFRDSYDADFPDQLAPRAGSIAALDYLGGAGGTAAIQYDAGGCRRVVYVGFPFETIAATKRSALMARVLGYLGGDGCLVLPPQAAIATPISGSAFNIIPDFGGTALGVKPIDRVEVWISDPGGRYWNGQSWITASQWLVAAGTADWHYPLPPLEQGQYRLGARVWDTTNLSDTTPALASFIYDTVSPTLPTLLAPADGSVLTGAPSGFFWRGPLSDTGSAVGYNLQINGLNLTRTVTYYIPSEWFASGIYTWRVRAIDAAGNRSPWTTSWTFVVGRYNSYLPLIRQDYGQDVGFKSKPSRGIHTRSEVSGADFPRRRRGTSGQ
jgi:N-acetylmuramoyl-L-alanine amidase